MKLNLIKIASLIMVLSMVFALAIPAFAEGEGEATEPATTYTVTYHYSKVAATPYTLNEGDKLGETIKDAQLGRGFSYVEFPSEKEFYGWSTDGTFEGIVDEDTVVTGNMELYPVYSYYVTLNFGPNSIRYAVLADETLWGLDVYTRRVPFVDDQGKELVGWFCDGEEVTAETAVTKNMDVYAKYVANIHIGDKTLNKKMLDVKYQIREEDATANTVDVRFVTSIDCLDYDNVTFKFTFDGDVYTQKSYKAFTALTGEDRTPAQAFIAESQYFVALTVTGMPTNVFETITVQAILELADGTTVEGNVCPVAFN
jgi:hypothetical protein